MRQQIHKNYNMILDILRIAACAGVFCTHIWQSYGREGNRFYELVGKVCHSGGNGVVILFCLSGYLAWCGMDREKFNRSIYWKKRFFRLSPAFFIVMGAYLAAGLLPLRIGILRYFTYTNGIIPSHDFSVYNNKGGLWTMSCFAVFYVLSPFLKRYVRSLKSAFIAMVSVFLFGKLFDFILHPVLLAYGADEVTYMEAIFPIGNMYLFLMGVVAYYALKEKKEYIAILAATVLISAFLSIEKIDYPLWGSVAVVFIVLSGRITIPSEESSFVSKLIRGGSLISYEVYLSHYFFIELFKSVSLPLEPVIILGVTIVSSVLLHWVTEQVTNRYTIV